MYIFATHVPSGHAFYNTYQVLSKSAKEVQSYSLMSIFTQTSLNGLTCFTKMVWCINKLLIRFCSEDDLSQLWWKLNKVWKRRFLGKCTIMKIKNFDCKHLHFSMYSTRNEPRNQRTFWSRGNLASRSNGFKAFYSDWSDCPLAVCQIS